MRVYFHLPYRQAEGVVLAHAGNKIPSIPNYSTINSTRVGDRRCTRFDIINIAGIRHQSRLAVCDMVILVHVTDRHWNHLR